MRVALCIVLLALSGCSLRDGLQRHEAALYGATLADITTSHLALERGFQEANPLLRPIAKETGTLGVALFQIAAAEWLLWRERIACRDLNHPTTPTLTQPCVEAQNRRHAVIFGHLFGAGFNAAGLWSAD